MNRKSLTAAQVAALAYAATHKGAVSSGRGIDMARATAQALKALGLIEFVGSTGYRHGIGAVTAYKLTAAGAQLVRIGRMLRSFSTVAVAS